MTEKTHMTRSGQADRFGYQPMNQETKGYQPQATGKPEGQSPPSGASAHSGVTPPNPKPSSTSTSPGKGSK
jgi:hypothetical protein